MDKIILTCVLAFCFITTKTFTQENIQDTTSNHIDTASKKYGNGYGFWFIPSKKHHIYGVALGLFGSEVICNIPIIKHSHGINIQLFGQGLFIPFNKKVFGYKNMYSNDTSLGIPKDDHIVHRAIHNGILLSSFGTMTDISNGIILSGWFSFGYKANGIAINALSNKYTFVNGLSISISNESYQTNGVQIGLVNRTRKLRGFQFGFWNVNDKRKLPFINWCFKP